VRVRGVRWERTALLRCGHRDHRGGKWWGGSRTHKDAYEETYDETDRVAVVGTDL